MSKVKNQHYIPQLYLRNFSTDEQQKTIGLFNIKNERFVRCAPIKNQASRNYFYGEDGLIESILGQIEGNAAPMLKELIRSKQLQSLSPSKTIELYTFCLLMKARTKGYADLLQESIDNLTQKILSYDEKMKKYSGQYKFQINDAAQRSVQHMLMVTKDALDLSCKMIINVSPLAFITSDTPMTTYNQFLEQRKHKGGHYGILLKGLQLFLPISPLVCLIFYDDWAYKIGDRKKNTIVINNTVDIEKLNSLHMIQCKEQLFFDTSIQESYVMELLRKYSKKRISKGSATREAGRRIDSQGNERILLHSLNLNYQLNLELSFCSFTKKAKHHQMSDYTAQLRNEKLRLSNRPSTY